MLLISKHYCTKNDKTCLSQVVFFKLHGVFLKLKITLKTQLLKVCQKLKHVYYLHREWKWQMSWCASCSNL